MVIAVTGWWDKADSLLPLLLCFFAQLRGETAPPDPSHLPASPQVEPGNGGGNSTQ